MEPIFPDRNFFSSRYRNFAYSSYRKSIDKIGFDLPRLRTDSSRFDINFLRFPRRIDAILEKSEFFRFSLLNFYKFDFLWNPILNLNSRKYREGFLRAEPFREVHRIKYKVYRASTRSEGHRLKSRSISSQMHIFII